MEMRGMITQNAYMYDGLAPTLSVSGCLWAKNYRNTYVLSAVTPETLKAYLEINNRNNGHRRICPIHRHRHGGRRALRSERADAHSGHGD